VLAFRGLSGHEKCGPFILFANTLVDLGELEHPGNGVCLQLLHGAGFIAISPHRYVRQILRAGKIELSLFHRI
jgi:hypothetical protein